MAYQKPVGLEEGRSSEEQKRLLVLTVHLSDDSQIMWQDVLLLK